jgi:hypothetical protein
MPRKLQVDVTAQSGAIAECVIWVNHNLVADRSPPASWTGKIPSGTTPVTIEVSGIGTSIYHVAIEVDGQTIADADRSLHGGADVFTKPV